MGTAAIKKCKSIIKKEKKGNRIVLLAKALSTIRVLISVALIYSYINDDEFVLVNNGLREYDTKKEKKN